MYVRLVYCIMQRTVGYRNNIRGCISVVDPDPHSLWSAGSGSGSKKARMTHNSEKFQVLKCCIFAGRRLLLKLWCLLCPGNKKIDISIKKVYLLSWKFGHYSPGSALTKTAGSGSALKLCGSTTLVCIINNAYQLLDHLTLARWEWSSQV